MILCKEDVIRVAIGAKKRTNKKIHTLLSWANNIVMRNIKIFETKKRENKNYK